MNEIRPGAFSPPDDNCRLCHAPIGAWGYTPFGEKVESA